MSHYFILLISNKKGDLLDLLWGSILRIGSILIVTREIYTSKVDDVFRMHLTKFELNNMVSIKYSCNNIVNKGLNKTLARVCFIYMASLYVISDVLSSIYHIPIIFKYIYHGV